MADVLSDIMDRVVDLLEGRPSGVTRSIPSGLFKHVPFDAEYGLTAAVSKPYPFEIEDAGEFQPADVPSTISPNNVWHGANLLIRVAYMADPHNAKERLRTIQEGRYYIRRCLDDPDSFSTLSGFSGAWAHDGEITSAVLPGSDNEQDVMLLLEVPVRIHYREDHTS